MKLQYKYQRFQAEAARSVTDVFLGQPFNDNSVYRMDMGRNNNQADAFDNGYGNNPIQLHDEDLAANIRNIQMRLDLKPIERLQGPAGAPMLTVEMETGTGKTYTYIKTMFELNKLYGWSKFIVVVPSIAIREGVAKSFTTMQEHFAQEYGKRIQFFIYNSKQLAKIDGFASDSGIHVMIINTQAFNTSMKEDSKNKDARIIFSERDEFQSRRPIDVIARTRPIMIIDEPQSVLGANKKNATREGLKKFDPLFYVLYSATHRKEDIYNMVYRLDAMDAYNKKLVKKIEVKGISQKGDTATNGFVYLDGIVIGKGNPQARLTFNKKYSNGVKETTALLSDGDDLYVYSENLEEYKDNFRIESIDGETGLLKFLNGTILYEGDANGDVNEELMRRIQIRETIRTHFERERALFDKGIKVLSLFFIDEVSHYRKYNENNEAEKGIYAQIFEVEYNRVIEEINMEFTDGPYIQYLKKWNPEQVHQGYFSIDNGKFVNSKVGRGETDSDDVSAYDLIMKDKERLLSFDEPVRFIFSHSALKEGWDNPNVFQICTLKDTNNELKKRQEVGRGMRLCVNKNGERQDQDVLGDYVFDTNILTVIASESYENFAAALQTEIAENIGERPLVVTQDIFEGASFKNDDGEMVTISNDQARRIYNKLLRQDYIDDDGKLTEKYYKEKNEGTLDFGDELNPLKKGIEKQLGNLFNPESIKPDNARKVKEATFKEENFYKKEFQELWKHINVKTVYEVDFDSSELIKKSIKAIDEKLNVTMIKFEISLGELKEIKDKETLKAGEAMTVKDKQTFDVDESVGGYVKYDLVGKLVERTGLTRKTIVEILKGINNAKFKQFQYNPEDFIIKVGNIINVEKALSVVEKIEYKATDQTFDTSIFTDSTIRGKIDVNAIESKKSLYDLVVVDSLGVEKNFAEELEKHQEVEVYTKLPRGFFINTPMGHYNPDWAVCFKEGTVKHIYFIAETKGTEWNRAELRPVEESKIECATKHFEAICGNDSNIKYGVAKDYETLLNMVGKVPK